MSRITARTENRDLPPARRSGGPRRSHPRRRHELRQPWDIPRRGQGVRTALIVKEARIPKAPAQGPLVPPKANARNEKTKAPRRRRQSRSTEPGTTLAKQKTCSRRRHEREPRNDARAEQDGRRKSIKPHAPKAAQHCEQQQRSRRQQPPHTAVEISQRAPAPPTPAAPSHAPTPTDAADAPRRHQGRSPRHQAR